MKASKLAVLLLYLCPLCFVFGDNYTTVEETETDSTTEKTLIDFSETQSARTITSHDIEQLPVVTIDELIKLQPGVVRSDHGLHLRGGASDEITYYVDGLITMWPYITGWQHINMNPSAIEEITLASAGFDAKYGDALSGIVHIITKQGGARHSAKMYYLTDELLSGDKLNFGYNHYNFSFGGPFVVSRLRYFISGDLMLTDAFQDALYKIPSPRNDYHFFGKFTYLFPNARGQFSLSRYGSREQWVRWSPYTKAGNDLKYFGNRPMTRTKNRLGMAALDYIFPTNNGTPLKMSLKIGWTHFDRCYGNRDYEWEEEHNRQWHDDYRFKAEHLIDYLIDEDYRREHGITIRDVLMDSIVNYHTMFTSYGPNQLRHIPWSKEGIFYAYGDFPVWFYWQSEDFQVRYDIDYWYKNYELKAGVHYIQYDTKYYNNPRAWDPDWGWINHVPFYDEWTPRKFVLYFQNRFNVDRILIQLGFRLENFDPNKKVSPFDSLVPAQSSSILAPRIGIVIPITERMKLRFNYGHYLKLHYQYDLKRYKTIMYESAIESQIHEDLAVGFCAYFKRTYDFYQINSEQFDYIFYEGLKGYDYSDIKGFQFDLKKRMANIWALGITYNLQYANGDDLWQSPYYEIPWDTIEYTSPLDFDERHTIKVYVEFEFPKSFNFTLLRDFTNSFVFSYHSGHPYTPEDYDGYQIDSINSACMPHYWNIDWKFSRRIRLGPAQLVLTWVLFNLFNTKQVIEVYPSSGQANEPDIPEIPIGQFSYVSIHSTRYSPQGDDNHDGLMTPEERRDDYMAALKNLYADPTNYNGSFRIRVGIGIQF